MRTVLPGSCLAVFLAAAALAPAPAAAQNLLANPGFESGYAGWTTFGNGVQLSAASGDFIVRTGTEASKIYGEFTGCPIPSFDVGGYFQSFTPVAGRDYEFSGYARVSSDDPMLGTVTCQKNRCVAKIAFFNAASGGTEISSNEIVIADGNTPLNQWVPFAVTAPVPPGALRMEALILFLQPACDEGAVFVDDLFLASRVPVTTPNLLVNPSFDTNLGGWTAFGNALYEGRGNTLPQFAFARRTPPGAMKMYSTFVLGSDSGVYQGFAATPGSEWEMTLHSLNACAEDPIDGTSDSYATAKISFLDGSFPAVEIGSAEQVIVNAASPKGTWVKHRIVAQAPVGTVTVRAYVLFISPSLLPQDACFIDDVSLRQTVITGVNVVEPVLVPELKQNVPNPFRGSTRIEFVLPRTEGVDLAVYDVAGRRVTTLVDRPLEAGAHTVTWDGRLPDGTTAAAGVYQYVLRTSEGQTSRRMMHLK